MSLPNIDLNNSLIEQGIKSSGAVLLRNALSTSLSLSLSVSTVFEHPVPNLLADHLLSLLENPQAHNNEEIPQIQQEIAQLISEMNFPDISDLPALYPTRDGVRHILVTGATGFVGSHLLVELLRTTRATIHCVVRAPDDRTAHARVMDKLREMLCWTPHAESRVVAHAGDLVAPNLGIPVENRAFFEKLELVYHLAAVVNWVLPYSQMRENFTGVAELIKMIGKSGKKILLHFISTASAVNVDFIQKGQKPLVKVYFLYLCPLFFCF